jgi:hypothetical protein
MMKYLFFGLLLGGCGLDSMNTSDTSSATFGDLSISPSTMDFGFVQPGETGKDSFVILNTGRDPIALRGLGVVGSPAFSVTATTEVPPSLNKGDRLVLDVSFTPTGYEDYDAALALQTDMPGLEYLETPITGTGLQPAGDSGGESNPILSTDVKKIDFGEGDLDKYTIETLTLQNVSGQDVMVKQISFTGDAFDWAKDLALPYLLKAGDSKIVTLNFLPTQEKIYLGEAIVESDDPAQPELSISLEGKGVDICTICAGIIQVNTGEDPYTLTGFMSLSGQEDSRTVSLTNIGDQLLTVSSVQVMNDTLFPGGTFKITGLNSPMKLEPYETGSFNVVYKANGQGYELAIPDLDMNVIHIYSDDPYEPDYVIGLSGLAL